MRWQQLMDWILALRPDWDPAELGGFRYLEGGYSNANYRFRYGMDEFVLRVPGKPTAFTDRAREQSFYQTLTTVAIPEVVGFNVATGHMISRWIHGRLMADLAPSPERLLAYLVELHERLEATVTVAPDVLGRVYDPVAQARIFLAAEGTPHWIRQLGDEFRWDPPRMMLCHNDLNPWNLIETRDGRWVTLDWEWFGRNDPLFDLVALHQGLALDDALLPGLAEAMTDPISVTERLKACLTAFWLREYGWANAEIAAGNVRPEIAAQRDLGEQKLAALV